MTDQRTPITPSSPDNTFDPSDLFPWANHPVSRDGTTSADLWHQQEQADQQERERLIAAVEYQRRLNEW